MCILHWALVGKRSKIEIWKGASPERLRLLVGIVFFNFLLLCWFVGFGLTLEKDMV
jgi:hypothetical protein